MYETLKQVSSGILKVWGFKKLWNNIFWQNAYIKFFFVLTDTENGILCLIAFGVLLANKLLFNTNIANQMSQWRNDILN